MGFGGHRHAHHRRVVVVHQSPRKIDCRAGSQAGEDVGCRHGATCRDDEVDGRILQQGERARATPRRTAGQRLPPHHGHLLQREHRHLCRHHPQQHQHPAGTYRRERQHHLVEQPAHRPTRENGIRCRDETRLLEVSTHQNQPWLWHRAIPVLQRVTDLHRLEDRPGRHVGPLHGGNHAQLHGRTRHRHQRRPNSDPQLRQPRLPHDARHQLRQATDCHHARRERPAANRV